MAFEDLALDKERSIAQEYKAELLGSMFGYKPFAVGGARRGNTRVLPDGANIVGVGYGAKATQSSLLAEEAVVRVYVRAKLPRAHLAEKEVVPSQVNGKPTDVVPVGDILATRAAPTACGVSVGHRSITAGTLGCLVMRDNDERTYILSNNHVLAAVNAGVPGDAVVQPGPLDGPIVPPDDIAELTDFHPLDVSGGPNEIDAAVAALKNAADVTPDILLIGPIGAPSLAASLHQSVRKTGRTTRHTLGVINDLSADIKVLYGSQRAEFEDQLGIVGIQGPFSLPGDSGSLIVDAVTRQPVGLLFAGGANQTFANRIDPVLTRFGAQIKL